MILGWIISGLSEVVSAFSCCEAIEDLADGVADGLLASFLSQQDEPRRSGLRAPTDSGSSHPALEQIAYHLA
jgi:hypothetical protein